MSAMHVPAGCRVMAVRSTWATGRLEARSTPTSNSVSIFQTLVLPHAHTPQQVECKDVQGTSCESARRKATCVARCMCKDSKYTKSPHRWAARDFFDHLNGRGSDLVERWRRKSSSRSTSTDYINRLPPPSNKHAEPQQINLANSIWRTRPWWCSRSWLSA
jgi:hypothetical protein